jgi:signal transduction histidine kinase
MRSLQGKIILVYLALAALAFGLSLLALLELNLIASKVRAGSKVAEFFDTTLELRRFEKNHFLYGQPQDLRENARYVEHAHGLLRRDRETFSSLIGAAPVQALADDLLRYGRLMARHAGRPDDEALAAEVRTLGKRIVTAGEALAARERQKLHDALSAHQRNLLISVAGVVGLLALAGISLARWVTRPLHAMEASMEAVAQGQLRRLTLDVRERELASLTQAFNHVLDELERRQHTLVQAEKLASLGTLLSGVAHELNNPLSNISSTAQILNEDGDMPADLRRELLTDIDQETGRAAKIVRSLLDYARDRDFQRQPVNLLELVDETLRFLKNQRGPGIEIRLAIPADLTLAADRPRLQQALLNLLKNAFEAMGEYGELTVKASLGKTGRTQDDLPVMAGSCRPGTPVVDLVIADSGPGIPAGILPRIFDPFYTTKPVGHGSGLGLFIVHEIVDEHGGCIGADNLPDGGARFHIRLPATETGAAARLPHPSATPSAGNPEGRP